MAKLEIIIQLNYYIQSTSSNTPKPNTHTRTIEIDYIVGQTVADILKRPELQPARKTSNTPTDWLPGKKSVKTTIQPQVVTRKLFCR